MDDTTTIPYDEAMDLRPDGDALVGTVAQGWDVFGIPHGGYLLGLAGKAVLGATGAPDVFTITTHYLRKARFAPIRFEVHAVGGSRRFTSVTATATQGEDVVLSVMALVGDRTGIDGPSWRREEPWSPDPARLTPRAGSPEMAAADVRTPEVAARAGEHLDVTTLGFTRGTPDGTGEIRAVTHDLPTDQIGALVACDVTPPAAWNALGVSGWVPTVELTAHVRARSGVGPMGVVVGSRHIEAGFLDEDALVHDADGTLLVQSRQLARWSA